MNGWLWDVGSAGLRCSQEVAFVGRINTGAYDPLFLFFFFAVMTCVPLTVLSSGSVGV